MAMARARTNILLGIICLLLIILTLKTFSNDKDQTVVTLQQADTPTPGDTRDARARGDNAGVSRRVTAGEDVRKAWEAADFTPPSLPDELSGLQQGDDRLADHIRSHWLLPPFSGPRNLLQPHTEHYSQRGQSKYIDNLLKQKTGGFFIECGAATGEELSNSLFFEKSRNWTGLLIEANPDLFRTVLGKRRHAYMMNTCLSPTTEPSVLNFRLAGLIGGLTDFMEDGHKKRVKKELGEAEPIKIQCFPLASILRAMGVSQVDYFSLDIEGAEYDILEHFPFDEIRVDVLTIEYVVSNGGGATAEKLKKITDLMIGRYGYKKASYKGSEDIMLIR